MQTQFRHERIVTETSSGIPLGDLTGLPILPEYPEQHLDHEDDPSAPQSEPEQTTDTAKLDNTAQQESPAQENAPSVSSPAQLMTTADPASLDPASTSAQQSGIDFAKLARGESVELASGLVVKLEGSAAYSLTWTGSADASAPANTPMLKITLPFAELDAAKAALPEADKLALQVARLSTLDFSDFDSTAPQKSAAMLDILKGGATEITASHLDGLISTESKLTLKADKISLSDSNLEGVALSVNCKTCELSELSFKNSSVTIFADTGRIEGGTFGDDVILGGNLGEMVVSKTTTLLCTAPKANLINVVWEGLGSDVESRREFMTRNRGFSYRSDLASPLLIATGEKLTVQKYVESMAPKLAASTATKAVKPARKTLQPKKLERYLSKPAPKPILKSEQKNAATPSAGTAPSQASTVNLSQKPTSSAGVKSEEFTPPKTEDQDLVPTPEPTHRQSSRHAPQAGRKPSWFTRHEWLIGGGAVSFAILAILAALKLGGASKQPRDPNDDKPGKPVPAQVNATQPSSQPTSQPTPLPMFLDTTPLSTTTLPAPTTLPAAVNSIPVEPTRSSMTPAIETPLLSQATLPQVPAAQQPAPEVDTSAATSTAEPAAITVQSTPPQSNPPTAPNGAIRSSAFVSKELLEAATPDVQDQPRRVAPGSGHSGASFVPPELLELASPRSPN